ncbi:unnamed protein product [Somion occarium]|uniref:Uncharacterized protein n=1 Tax=Somion occarium TaxID=3059160 RepID=A0ABP1DBX5_9APHY
MPVPTCPTYKHPDDHDSQDEYFTHVIDTMTFFYYWGHTGYLRINEMFPIATDRRRTEAYERATAQFRRDPVIADLTFPDNPERRKAFFDRCKKMCAEDIRDPSDAFLRTFYGSTLVQMLVDEVSLRYRDNLQVLSDVLAGAQQKVMIATGDWERHVAASNQARQEVALNRLFDRIGDTFAYRHSLTKKIVQCKILNGGGDVMGEEWFWVRKTVAGESNEDMITGEELEQLLSCQI